MTRGGSRVLYPLIAIGWFAAVPAHAQRADDENYKALISEALSEYQQGAWLEARILFRRAHAVQPSARTWLGIGLSSFQAQHYVDALRALEAALADTRKPLPADRRREAEDVIKRATRFVGRLKLRVEPESAAIAIDGVAVDRSQGAALVDPGPHEIVATAAGYASISRRITVEGGAEAELAIALEPTSRTSRAPEPAAAEPATTAAATQDARPEGSGSAWPWLGLGASVAVAGAGGVLLALGLGDRSAVDDAKDGSRWSEIEDANDRSVPLQVAGGIALGLGAAGLAACTILLLSEGSAEPSVQAAITPAGAVLRGSF